MTSTDTTQTRKCLGGCGYTLRSAKAIARGHGSRCWAKVGKAAQEAGLSAWTSLQVEEARQAIEDGAVVPNTRPGVFHVVSVHGTEVHRTHRNGCNCTAGLKTHQPRPSWHSCATLGITAAWLPPEVDPADAEDVA
jgi:hypothetical protein